MPQQKTETVKKELFQMLEGEQQVLMKAEELLEKTTSKFQIFVPDDYLSQLYYNDFTEALREKLGSIDIALLTEDSAKAAFFIEQMEWPAQKCQTVHTENLPCFMISDKRELLIAFHESDTIS